MINGCRFSCNRLARTIVVGLSLGATGCGDGTTPLPKTSDVTSKNAEADSSAKTRPTGHGLGLAPGGDLDRKARKALKQKEKAAPNP
jgi:hypothetical protein